MSIVFTASNSGLTRSGAFLTPASDWTMTGWAEPVTADPSGGLSRTYFLHGDPAYVASYIRLASGVNLGNVRLELFDGTTHTNSVSTTVPLDAWFSWGLVYFSSSHLLLVYIAGVLVDTISINLSTFTFSVTSEYVATDTNGSWSNIAAAYLRSWQTIKNLAQLRIEWASPVAVSPTSLVADTPLTDTSTLTDASGHGHGWSTSGAAGATSSGPFPANALPTTATVVSSLPFSTTQLVSVGGVTPAIWYQYTALADGMLALWMYGDLTIYKPQVDVYLAPGTTTVYMGVGASPAGGSLTEPMQFPVRGGETYLFRARLSLPAVSPSTLTVRVELFAPSANAPRESIAINDDGGLIPRGDGTDDTFPLALLSTTADYTPLKYIFSFPSGETGDCLNTGVSLVSNDDESGPPRLIGFDSTFAQLFSNLFPSNFVQDIRANRTLGKFFVLFVAGTSPFDFKVSRVAPSGAVEFTTSGIVHAGLACIATSPDGTICYFCANANPSYIGRWDMVNDVALTNLVSGLSVNAFTAVHNMLCLEDGSVIALVSTPTYVIRRYSSAGTLLNTYTAASLGVDYLNGADSRFAYSVDAGTFWYRNLENADADGILRGYFIKIDVATGTVLTRVRDMPYSVGDSLSNPKIPTLPALFGYSESCTFWVLPVGTSTCDAVAVTVQPVGQSVQAGLSVTLSVTVTGTAPFSYQWYVGTSGDTSNPIGGATSATYMTPFLTVTTSYWVRVTNECGTADSDTAVITVEAPPPPPGLGCPDDLTVGTPLTLADALDQLARRLDDTAFVHWTEAELSRYLREAMRTLSAYTQQYRNRESFVSVANAPFYYLPDVLPTLRSYNVTDTDLVTDIEYALMEPPGVPYTGTEQFTQQFIVDCIKSRLNEFLEQTGGTLTRSLTGLTPDANGRIVLPTNVIGIRRAAWVMQNGTVVPLKREDEWAMNHYEPTTWSQLALSPSPTVAPSKTWPTGYSVGVTPPLTVQLSPVPSDPGTLDLIAIVTSAPLDPTVGVLLGIPDDWSWVVKWGALAELLRRDGVAFDPIRAAHCEARWRLGIAMAQKASVVLQGYINSAPVALKSLVETDVYRRTWQTTPGAPTEILTAGWNLVGLKVPPNSTAYTVTLDVVCNVLVPLELIDCLQVDEFMRDCLMDYAQYLAIFKEGPAQLEQATQLYDSFARCCGITVELDVAAVPERKAIFDQTFQDERVKPRLEPPGPLEKP